MCATWHTSIAIITSLCTQWTMHKFAHPTNGGWHSQMHYPIKVEWNIYVHCISHTSLSLLLRMPRTKSVRFLSNIRSKFPFTFLSAIVVCCCCCYFLWINTTNMQSVLPWNLRVLYDKNYVTKFNNQNFCFFFCCFLRLHTPIELLFIHLHNSSFV